MIASVAIVAYNEEEYINNILNDVLNQDYLKEHTEVLLIDSRSTDNTKAFMRQFKDKHESDYFGIQLLDNQGKIQSCGWNVAIQNFKGDVLFRIDAHAKIPTDFISRNMELQQKSEFVTGGPRFTIVDKDNIWANFLLAAENSMFGSSISSYRRSTEPSYVKSLFHGAYRRCVLDDVGLFNVNLGRTEDNEFHYRIRNAGYKICYSPQIFSYQYVRNTLMKMLKQKYGNGYWIGRTFWICPRCLEKYHFVPLFFVSGILFTSVLGWLGFPELSIIMWSLYWVLAIVMMIISLWKSKNNLLLFLLPFVFLLLHLSYGIGTFIGLCSISRLERTEHN